MFEVNKIYTYGSLGNHHFKCVYVGEKVSFFQGVNNNLFHDWAYNSNFKEWLEVSKEPRRWSEFSGYYISKRGEPYWLGRHDSLVKANYAHSYPSSGKLGAYIIRFDWEQHEGKEKKLVKTELVGVPNYGEVLPP